MFILFDGPYPFRPSLANRFGVRPSTVRLEDAAQPDDPRRDLHVDKRQVRAQEERALLVRRIDQFRDLDAQLLGVRDLFLRVLFLQDAVETRDYGAIRLKRRQLKTGIKQARHDCGVHT